jgi:hypothetical protein
MELIVSDMPQQELNSPSGMPHCHDVLPIAEIPGLIRTESHSLEEVMKISGDRHKELLPHDEVFGEFVTLVRHLPVPLDYTFNYLSDVRNIAEFTISLRNFVPCAGRDGLWIAEESFRRGTRIYIKCNSHRDTGCIEHPCAWENSENLWMYYAFRLYDGKRVMNRPGTVVQWTNFKHTNYCPGGPFEELIGAFPYFYEIHGIELDNLTTILKTRFKHQYGYLLDQKLPGGLLA